MNFRPLFTPPIGRAPRVAILLSGTGSNARVILKLFRAGKTAFDVVTLLTDNPKNCAARELATEFDLPLIENDIREFYRENGETSIKLDTERRRKLRDVWSNQITQSLRDCEVDFALFTGFVPLTNLAAALPCLNVHPGDLTRRDESGIRIFAGLHVKPVESAIIMGEPFLRSSVILVQPFSGDTRREVDAGPVLGISAPVAVELRGHTLTELRQIKATRTVPPYSDLLRQITQDMLEKLKVHGDHVVFPQTANDFALGKFTMNDMNVLHYNHAPILTVEYSATTAPRVLQTL